MDSGPLPCPTLSRGGPGERPGEGQLRAPPAAGTAPASAGVRASARKSRSQIYLRTVDVVGDIDLDPLAVALPGDTVPVTITLGRPVAVEPGLGFAIVKADAPSAPAPSQRSCRDERCSPYSPRSAAGALVRGTAALPTGTIALMTAARDELRRLLEELPDEQVQTVLAEVRCLAEEPREVAWPPPWFSSINNRSVRHIRARRRDLGRRFRPLVGDRLRHRATRGRSHLRRRS